MNSGGKKKKSSRYFKLPALYPESPVKELASLFFTFSECFHDLLDNLNV